MADREGVVVPMRGAVFGPVLAVALAVGGPVGAEVIALKADLSGRAEVPPTTTGGRGSADIQYDTVSRLLSWRIEYSGLTGLLSAAHFHGTASPATNAGIMVPIAGVNQPTPLVGAATLTEQQADDMLGGRWYINLHTPTNPAGEIRGQVVRK